MGVLQHSNCWRTSKCPVNLAPPPQHYSGVNVQRSDSKTGSSRCSPVLGSQARRWRRGACQQLPSSASAASRKHLRSTKLGRASRRFHPSQWKTHRPSITYQIFKCQVKILEKIANMDLSLNSLIVIILKCLMYRGVTGFRPPPKHQKGHLLMMLLGCTRPTTLISYGLR